MTRHRKHNSNRLVNRRRCTYGQSYCTTKCSEDIVFSSISDKDFKLFSDSAVKHFSEIGDISSISLSPTLNSSVSVLNECDTNSLTLEEASFNQALQKTSIENQLCNCNAENFHWCFVHSRSKDIQRVNAFKAQQFGFINHVPLDFNTTGLNSGKLIDNCSLQQWAFDAHARVKRSGQSNYLKARIKVPTKLNIDNWRRLCANFQDQLLLEYLEYRFPLCTDRSNITFDQLVENHSSANNFSQDIDIYLHKEVRHNAIVGPCKQVPFPVHYSPLLSWPKPGDSRRIIVNLSHPTGTSVNNGISDCVYDNKPFLLKYPTVDAIIDNINQHHGDVLLSKIDLSRAFRNCA